ncbi:hypothetical protein CVT26_014148 [Gymnopilus dilepis]|uniref:H/ACA ribonucleoprotein complex subunit n=1 Tax=Gymnopilus dilepis TaxID=231916 RepID=A0A409VUE3_9AGAR|nr:hypothetical protein CVT26_014148 [Gymnopilus dilepis]
MSRGGPRGGFGRGGARGGGRGGFQQRDAGPPDEVLEMGTFVHAVEDEMFCSSSMPDKVPYFNAPIYLQNKSQIGKVDEILGPINEVYFTIKMGEGLVASSFKKGDKVYIGGDKLLPIERFLPKPKAAGEAVDGVDLQPVAAVAAVLESGEDFKEAGEVALAADFRLVEGLVEGLEEVVVFVEAEAAVAVEVFEDPNLVEALKLFILSSVTCLIEHYYILRR